MYFQTSGYVFSGECQEFLTPDMRRQVPENFLDVSPTEPPGS